MADPTLINNPWFALGSSLLSGVVAVVISTLYYKNAKAREAKLDCFRRLLGSRYALTLGVHSDSARDTFFQALDEVVVIFASVPTVVTALRKLLDDSEHSALLHDNLITLIREMADHLDIDSKGINDSFFLKPFVPRTGVLKKY